ncbi:hypothetical protein J6590_018953 [Homalodisca vitripennis]|nr:hypothetical protein J6590_018953 [Homalodisca vitripennis]
MEAKNSEAPPPNLQPHLTEVKLRPGGCFVQKPPHGTRIVGLVADVTFLQGRTVSPRRHPWTNCPTFQNSPRYWGSLIVSDL